MIEEFKKFIMRGNVMDLAVGVIIGAAFGKIVDSLVGDIIMPVIGRILGGLDFSQFYVALAAIPKDVPNTLDALKKAGIPVFAYGSFITAVIHFVLLAFVIFWMVKAMNRMMAKPAPQEAAAAPPEDVVLLREIRDALRRA